MSEEPTINLSEIGVSQEANTVSAEQPAKQRTPENSQRVQRLDAEEIAAGLEKAGLHTLAEKMRQPTDSDKEIAHRNSQEHNAWSARQDAKTLVRPPSVDDDKDKTQRLDLHDIANLAEQQKKDALAAELRRIADKPSTT